MTLYTWLMQKHFSLASHNMLLPARNTGAMQDSGL